ncbi:Uu.00g079690.m01.CDS01 [Anthostomella pinea]|uniref:Mitochondrial distribution and morphology protein 10 n=1 Tax=Anthostomella pinea TaxID=933095 RepID=A0AAI8YJD4_9PEZI|nr:Uu.00g079690.m01.CDS01 [Anthostomella pinea]
MREFMDYIQTAFYTATGWNRDNSYSSLNATSDALLGFETPRGLRLTLSSLATPHFATAYQLGSVGVVDGSISYLYSTVPLDGHTIARSERIPLPDLLRSYRPLLELSRPGSVHDGGDGAGSTARNGIGANRKGRDVLTCGRLYLPMSMLEALVVRRLSPKLQMQVSAVSEQTLRNGGTVLGMIQYDEGRYGLEGLASSDGGLMGVRGLYNFGGDVANLSAGANGTGENGNGAGNGERERIYGRFSTGAELYYGTLNKSGGMSLGARFATLPTHKGTPLTATMTINPLMGNISWTYAVMAGSYCSLATKMDFNVYSYESDWAVGMELWRKKGAWSIESVQEAAPIVTPSGRPARSFDAKMEWRLDDALPTLDSPGVLPSPKVVAEPKKERSFQARMEWSLDEANADTATDMVADGGEDGDQYAGVLKARLDQHWRVGLLWEGRVKSLLFSLGSGIDLRRPDSPFRTLGLEVQFSS